MIFKTYQASVLCILLMGFGILSPFGLTSQRTIISGRVLEKDCKSNCGLQDAYLTAPKALPCVSGADGTFRMLVVASPGEEIYLRVQKKGFVELNMPPFLVGQNQSPEIEMARKKAPRNPNPVPVSRKLTGVVYDHKSLPIEGVTLREKHGYFPECTTDKNGKFSVTTSAKQGDYLHVLLEKGESLIHRQFMLDLTAPLEFVIKL